MTLIIKGEDILHPSSKDVLEVDSKNNHLILDTTSYTSSVKKTDNYSEAEIQELQNAIKSTIIEMGGNAEQPEPKYLKFIAQHADCYWGAIDKFLKDYIIVDGDRIGIEKVIKYCQEFVN